MSPQFVDFNADGHVDIFTATFDGSPHVSYGSKKGFAEPVRLLDTSGNRIMLQQFWDYEKREWSDNKEQPEGHCTSAVAFDWDADGDLDLLLGSYGNGNLFRQMNEGTASDPKFSGKNIPVTMDGGKEFALNRGVTTPVLIDYDGDGLLDLVCGSFGDSYGPGPGGGVSFYRNIGKQGAPEFAAAVELVPASPKGAQTPTRPDSGLYPYVVDYDSDGDLDLIVGGYSHFTPPKRELSAEEKLRVAELEGLIMAAGEELAALMQKAIAEINPESTKEEQQAVFSKLFESEEHKKAREKQNTLQSEMDQLVPKSQRKAFVWLYRRASDIGRR